MKAIIAAICLILSLFPAPATVRAEARTLYGRADVEDAYFCEKPDRETALFAIPETYCARIISEEDGWYHVQYAETDGLYIALYGYVRAEKLTVLDERPQTPYLIYPVDVKYSAGDTPDGFPPLADITVTAAFYGSCKVVDMQYSYLLCGDGFGYVARAYDDYPRIIPAQPTVGTPSSSPATVNVKLIVAVALTAIAAGVLLFLYFSGKRGYPRRSDNRQ